MNNLEFATVGKFICQPGAAGRLSEHCRAAGMRNPMLVSDKGLVAAGVLERVLAPLRKDNIEPLVYTDVEADPPESIVHAAIESARSHGVDGVLAVGGGSSLDVAKLVAVLTRSKQSLSDIYGIGRVVGERLPMILIPTTAGTGSEVTPISIVTTGATTKAGVVAAQLIPDLAILDAELTVGLPPPVTAATGIDAMVHAIEACTSKLKRNVYSEMLARRALKLMSQNLLVAVEDGTNLEARSQMLLGAMMAGQAFANAPVAAVHALAYPLGGNYHIPHGLSNSLVLPHVLRFNAPVAREDYARLLTCVQPRSAVGQVDNDCRSFISFLEDLIAAVQLPRTLSEMSIPEKDLPMLADEAMEQTRLLVNNPREMTRADALAVYQAAY
ncbi:MAG: iron-containing alcohol dehydrogenase [Gammaproteobacteria bacterium]